MYNLSWKYHSRVLFPTVPLLNSQLKLNSMEQLCHLPHILRTPSLLLPPIQIKRSNCGILERNQRFRDTAEILFDPIVFKRVRISISLGYTEENRIGGFHGDVGVKVV